MSVDMLEFVKREAFKFYPIENSENSQAAWKQCIKAIDEGGRNLKKRRLAMKDISNTNSPVF